MISLFAAGCAGGVVRGLTGLLKHQLSYKTVAFDPTYFLVTVALSGLVGLGAALALRGIFGDTDVAFAFAMAVGYAGGDFLEGVYKILFKKLFT